jgi:peptidoglycan/xylan/chitin deacetylase (PgdA/CDA1 family)
MGEWLSRVRKFLSRSKAARAVAVIAATAAVTSALAVVPASAATSPVVVSFTFDNNWESQMTAAADLQAAGMAGTFYVISGWIGLPGFMSMSDVSTLAADGDEIGGKTVNNADLPTLSSAEAERQICLSRDVLLNDGFQVSDFAYPFADLNATDETLVQECGYNSGRGVGNINSLDPGGCRFPDCPYAENIPPADPYQINTPDDAESNTTLANMEGDVTDALNNGGGWLAFSFHQICDTTTAGCDPTYSWSPELFQEFVTWLQGEEADGVSVKTVQQVIGGSVQPAVTAPSAPAAPVGQQALVNPTLTTADPNNAANPDCFQQASYGANTPSFSWSSTGGDGGGGEETISMTGLSSGDAKLISTEDLGQCAPTATAGDSYKISVEYQSTVPVFFTLYGRAADGTWKYWTQSPTYAPSSGWTQATWTTPQVPSTITALSYGMTIPSNGTLSTSDYSMVDIGSGVPAAAPVGVNALQNPLLETPDGSGVNPECWQSAGYGDNSPTFTWSPTGGQAGGEETIDMASVTSGDAKLIVPFDNGNCAPTVTAGDAYTVSFYYQSTVPVFITLYSRNANGTWGYWTQSPYFPAASGWTQVTWTTPDVPTDVNGASFGVTIDSPGTLSTSNYSFVNTGAP